MRCFSSLAVCLFALAGSGIAAEDDAVLRWNACARIIIGNGLVPSEEDRSEQQLE